MLQPNCIYSQDHVIYINVKISTIVFQRLVGTILHSDFFLYPGLKSISVSLENPGCGYFLYSVYLEESIIV